MQDASHTGLRRENDEPWIYGPGIIIPAPKLESEVGIPFSGSFRLCCGDGAPYTVVGTIDRDEFDLGDAFIVEGQITVLGSGPVPDSTPLEFVPYLIGDESGNQVGDAGDFTSAFMTPTGLPIVRHLTGQAFWSNKFGSLPFEWEVDGDRLVARFDGILRVPADLPVGTYALVAHPFSFPQGTVTAPGVLPLTGAFANLGVITVGNPEPMRLATTLSEGSKGGILPREQIGLWDISPRTLTRHDPVIPRRDAYGAPWSYHLGPFIPMSGLSDRAQPHSPIIQFDLEDSLLSIEITRPDGVVDVLGPAPLTRYAVTAMRTPHGGGSLCSGGGCPNEIPQLMGAGDTFAYEFPIDGDYVVSLGGYVGDLRRNRFDLSSTFDVTVANILDIETDLLPGTPCEVGNHLPVGLTIYPGVTADVVFEILHVAPDGSETRKTYEGTASREGRWDGDGGYFTFDSEGEYRVDVEALYMDDRRNMWVGRMTFGGGCCDA